MTVAQNDTIERYTISGTGPYPFSFRIFDESDLTVIAIDSVTNIPVTLVLDSDYEVTGVDDEDGGEIELLGTAATTYAADTLDIRSNIPLDQPSVFTTQGPYSAKAVELALDRISRQVQDMDRKVKSSVRLADSTLTDGELAPIANWLGKFLYVNPSGTLEPASAITQTVLTRMLLGETFYPQTEYEALRGFIPVDRTYPPFHLKRAGVIGDGDTVEDEAIDNTLKLGGWWNDFGTPGLLMRLTQSVKPTLRWGVESLQSSSSAFGGNTWPQPLNTKTFFIQDFDGDDGALFDFIGFAGNNQHSAGSGFRNIGFWQNFGNGSKGAGNCIRLVQLSDVLVSHWFRITRCNLEIGSARNPWLDAILIDSTAASSTGLMGRDCYLSELRIVCGTHANSAIKLLGTANLNVREVEANLANADIILSGTADRPCQSLKLNHCSFNKIILDYTLGLGGTGNSAATVTATGNTTDTNLFCDTSAAPYPDVSSAVRMKLSGKEYDGKFRDRITADYEIISGNNAVRVNSNLVSTVNSSTYAASFVNGFTGAAGFTMGYSITGHRAMLNVAADQLRASTGTIFSIGGLPVALTPVKKQKVSIIGLVDNNIDVVGTGVIDTDGSITLYNTATGVAGSGWTGSGNKGFRAGATIEFDLG